MRLGVIMDPLSRVHYKKDSTLAMLWEAADRGYELFFFEQQDLFLEDGIPYGDGKPLQVFRDPEHWYDLASATKIPLSTLDVILMRKDPPFNEEYIYTTYLLECAERLGVRVVNRPAALRDANEKFFTAYFPQCTSSHLITSSMAKLQTFWRTHRDIVCKPLNVMGGASVFRIQPDDPNTRVIFETLTQYGTVTIIAQPYIKAIVEGDKRILLIDGQYVPHALVRIPQGEDWRGNLAQGAKASVMPLSPRDIQIAETVGRALKERGLYFAGIDVIGEYLTEINVTSPTGIREIDEYAGYNVSAQLFDCIESHRK